MTTAAYQFKTLLPRKSLIFKRDLKKEVHAGDVKEIFEKLKEAYPNFIGTANWVTSEGVYVSQACHAHLARLKSYEGLYATENAAGRKSDNFKNLSRPFLHWFLYHSSYGEFILNRDDFEGCQNYGFVLDFAIPQPLLMNISIISRHFQECYDEAFELFNEVTDKGIDPTIAYCVIFCSNLSSLSKHHYKNTRVYSVTGHRVSHMLNIENITNIFNGVFGKDAHTGSMESVRSIYTASNLFKGSSYDHCLQTTLQKDEKFIAFMQKKRGLDAPEKDFYSPPNPFVRQAMFGNVTKKNLPGDFSADEIFHVLTYVQNEVKKGIKR